MLWQQRQYHTLLLNATPLKSETVLELAKDVDFRCKTAQLFGIFAKKTLCRFEKKQEELKYGFTREGVEEEEEGEGDVEGEGEGEGEGERE